MLVVGWNYDYHEFGSNKTYCLGGSVVWGEPPFIEASVFTRSLIYPCIQNITYPSLTSNCDAKQCNLLEYQRYPDASKCQETILPDPSKYLDG